MEQIYTIPVNEAFDACANIGEAEVGAEQKKPDCLCPVCRLYATLNENELERILGAAMMEPDVRIETNKQGFCPTHFRAMFARKNRLGLALMLESHLDCLAEELAPSLVGDLFKGTGNSAVSRAQKLEKDCYICRRIDEHFTHMIDTVVYLYRTEEAFRDKFTRQPFFCLPHYRMMAESARAKLPKKLYADFYRDLDRVTRASLDKLREDVSWFCKKFDYRYENEPWYNAKDAVERAIVFLSGGEASHL